MFPLKGKISDRIRSGEIKADPLAKRAATDDRPSAASVRNGSGRGLGKGATRARAGEGSKTHED